MTSVVSLMLLWLLPVLCGFVRPPIAHRHVRRPAAASLPRYQMMGAMVAEEEGTAGREDDGEINGEDEIDEAAIDALVRREVEAAFAGLEEALNSGDEQAALALIQSQGKEVLNNVLEQLEDDGQLLSSTIASRIEELTTSSRTEMMQRYDDECARTPAHRPLIRRVLRAHPHPSCTAWVASFDGACAVARCDARQAGGSAEDDGARPRDDSRGDGGA